MTEPHVVVDTIQGYPEVGITGAFHVTCRICQTGVMHTTAAAAYASVSDHLPCDTQPGTYWARRAAREAAGRS